jgi:hypothetical protein
MGYELHVVGRWLLVVTGGMAFGSCLGVVIWLLGFATAWRGYTGKDLVILRHKINLHETNFGDWCLRTTGL